MFWQRDWSKIIYLLRGVSGPRCLLQLGNQLLWLWGQGFGPGIVLISTPPLLLIMKNNLLYNLPHLSPLSCIVYFCQLLEVSHIVINSVVLYCRLVQCTTSTPHSAYSCSFHNFSHWLLQSHNKSNASANFEIIENFA